MSAKAAGWIEFSSNPPCELSSSQVANNPLDDLIHKRRLRMRERAVARVGHTAMHGGQFVDVQFTIVIHVLISSQAMDG
jgi:hypothetical protein